MVEEYNTRLHRPPWVEAVNYVNNLTPILACLIS